MSKATVWSCKITDEYVARLSKPTMDLLEEIVAIATEVNPPNLGIYRAVIYELGLAAVSVISKSLVQACNEATEQFAKKLATEPSP